MIIEAENATHLHDNPEPLGRRLAAFAVGLEEEQLSPPIMGKARTCLLDFLACAFEAQALPWGRQILTYARLHPRGDANVIGTELSLAPTEAAFVNGVLGHGLIREDMHVPSNCHFGVVIWPALLALAQTRKVTGLDLLTGAVAGYEVGGRIGRALFDAELSAKVRPTGTIGAIAASAAAARLLSLPVETATSALALSANAACGLNEWPWTGGYEVFAHAGLAARNAVTAVHLAETGMMASSTAIDGRAGLFASHGRRARSTAIDPLADGQFEIMSVYFKPAPACNFVQTPCQAALALSVEGLAPADIRAVQVATFPAALNYPGCNQPGPFEGVLAAKMSIQFSVASVLVNAAIGEANYASLDNPDVLRLARGMKLVLDPHFTRAYPARQGAEIRLSLADGSERVARLDDVSPASEATVRERFSEAAAVRLGHARASLLLSAIDGIAQQEDAAMIGRLAGLS
jgi:2-methylcitrate dehydratase PrpD